MKNNDEIIQDALNFIERYGGFDGGHHKQWVLDQLVRILTVDKTGYDAWIKNYQGKYDEKEEMYECEWDVGCPP